MLKRCFGTHLKQIVMSSTTTALTAQQRTVNVLNQLNMSATFSTATTSTTPSPFTKKPSSISNSNGTLLTPEGALSQEPLTSQVEEKARSRARELLPFNYGRALEPSGEQILQPVGYPTLAQKKSGKPIPELFQPLNVRGREFLKNRIVVSPMCMYSSDDGHLNDFHLVHLGQFALGGAGLVIVEATAVAFEGRISPTDSGLWKDSQIAPLKRINAFLRSQGCRAGIQLAHAGRKGSTITPFHIPRGVPVAEAVDETLGGYPTQIVGPSPLAFDGDYWTPTELTLQQIETLKQQFVAAAKRAVEAGFDYIEIHGAHGYLISEFLSTTSNKRTDAYGGSFDNRTRFVREIVQAVRQVVPRSSGIVLGVRLTCEEWVENGWHIEDTLRLVDQLATLEIDLIDCSSGGNSVTQKIKVGPGYQVEFAAAVKKAHPELLVGAVGAITESKQANDILAQGKADVVMLARQLLRTPHWALQAAQELQYEVEWAPQYRRGKLPTSGGIQPIPSSGQRS